MNVVTFPRGWHPYQDEFARAVAPIGVRYEPGEVFSDRTLAERSDWDAVHFQWVENLWATDRWWRRFRLVYGFRRYCALAKRLGKRIIWTVHNHGRHEGDRWGDRLGFGVVARAADLIIVHSRWSEEFIRSTYRPSGRVVCMPLGNFDGVYSPPRRSPAEVRTALGLDPSRPVCGVIGGVRPYRGHDLAIAAARAAGGRWQLLVAGHPIDREYGERVRTSVDATPNALCVLGRLSDAEYAEFVQACDVILLPYQDITGSAAMLAAWTLARPVVANDLPFFREFQPDDPAAGVVLPTGTTAAVVAAVDELLAIPVERREAASRAEADAYTWDKVIRPVVDVIHSWSATPAVVP